MKTTNKLLGLIAIAIIALTFFACGDKGDDPPPHVHEWEWRVTTPATTEADGVETETCITCGQTNGTRTIARIPFINIDGLETWLNSKPANTAETPYNIKLNIDDEEDFARLLTTLYADPDKYIYLDLSGSTITTIPDYAFFDFSTFNKCTTLTGITIPNSVIQIGEGAFIFCENLASVIIPNSVISIGFEAFSLCSSLTSVTIPNSVTSIAIPAFSSCTSLSTIDVATGNTAYLSQDGILYNKDKTVLHTYPAGKTDVSFSIPSSVTTIGDYALYYCSNLKSVTIPESVKSIGKSSFSRCTGITSLTIPDSVISFGSRGSFSYCSNLESVMIGNSVTNITEETFYHCTSLTNVTIGNSVTSFEHYAFGGCSSLNNITIPNSVTTIGYRAFINCTSLTSIIIPDSVTSIEGDAFSDCTALISVTFKGTIASSKFGRFNDLGDLQGKFYATDTANGTPGTYTTTAPVSSSSVWTKQ
ncbi:hypothetical protein R84B8_00630 [Treponema sp. R8-4-B8]